MGNSLPPDSYFPTGHFIMGVGNNLDVPGGSLHALRDFIVTLPSEPAEQMFMIEHVLLGASAAIKDPVVDVVKRLVEKLPLLCSEKEFTHLLESQGFDSRIPFQLTEEKAVPIYRVYWEMMQFGPVPYCSLSDAELLMVAYELHCADRTADGGLACPRATFDCLRSLIRDVLIPVQKVFVTQKAYAYMLAAVLYRMGMRLVGTSPNFALRPVRPVDVELRDQHAYLALRYTDEELLQYGVSTRTVWQLRRQSCYVFKDQWDEILARMELRKSRYLTAVRGNTHEPRHMYTFEAIQLDTFAAGRRPRDREVDAERYVRERERLLKGTISFRPVHSITDPQVISSFWSLIDEFLPLAQALRDALPFWIGAKKDLSTVSKEQIDVCLKGLALLREQDLSRKGIRQLTDTPLYILPFEALLFVAKEVHRLHRIISTDLGLHTSVELKEIPTWPKPEWLTRHGFNLDLQKPFQQKQ